MTMQNILVDQLCVLTLNIWGIPIVSSDRRARIDAISSELSTGKYDIVSLQEVWSQLDSQIIRERVESILPYSHYFHSGVMGAGLLVLSKYPIVGTFFHAWSVNGYFHRIQHADWFGGKGVGLCKIKYGEHILHLYNAHLHAEYDEKNDEYKTHRVIQAFDTAQFIEATRGNSVLQILAGDLNTQPQDISYKVLLHMSEMIDCCNSDTIATNECQHNSYTSKHALAKNSLGIRIDHIFIRGADYIETTIIEYSLPFPDRVPGQKFSYSDHEAVSVKLKLVMGKNFPQDATTCYDISTTATTNFISHSNSKISCLNKLCKEEFLKRIPLLKESIALCELSLQRLKTDRIYYYFGAFILIFILVCLVEFLIPSNMIYLFLKFIFFGVIIFCLFMGSIWNELERNGILSGKAAMEIMLNDIMLPTEAN